MGKPVAQRPVFVSSVRRALEEESAAAAAESLRGQAARLSHGVQQFRLAESAVGYGQGSAVAAPCADKAPQALAAGPAQARLTH